MTKSHHSIRRNIWAGLAVSVLLVGSVARDLIRDGTWSLLVVPPHEVDESSPR